MSDYKKLILLNATAATGGGALTILRQFLNNFPDEYNLYAFVSLDIDALDIYKLPKRPNINYIHKNVKSWPKRLYWDYWGFAAWCQTSFIKPDLIISLQNTGVRIKGNSRQLVYYHQPIPLYSHKWSIVKKKQRVLWFYKYIYLYFVKATTYDNTIFVTQFFWIKKKLEVALKIQENKIKVISPTVDDIAIEEIQKINMTGALKIFYPASSAEYKNHIEIINAFIYLKNKILLGDYVVYLTINAEEVPELFYLIKKNGLQKHFIFLGCTEFCETVRYYKSSDLILFPSILETFGLPLLEAALFGKKILVAHLDYACEVLSGYSGAEYLPVNNAKAWGDAIVNFAENKVEFSSWISPYTAKSWPNFFALVAEIME